jgi:hypothetical protein
VITAVDKLRILVVGALSREKGADVLEKTATYRDPLERLEYHLLGYAYRPLAPEVIQHGAYEDGRLDSLIAELKPQIIWVPAQWHETYCYALSAALRAGLPIISTDLGSFPERLAGRPLSFIKPWSTGPIEWNDTLLQIRDWMLAHQSGSEAHAALETHWHQPLIDERNFVYQRDYVVVDGQKTVSLPLPSLESVSVWCYPHTEAGSVSLSSREKWLYLLLRLRGLPGVHHLLRLIPFELQRKIKRFFSHRAIHDIINEQK